MEHTHSPYTHPVMDNHKPEDIKRLLDCFTYDDYVKTFITKEDKRYMPDYGKCRLLVELGYRSGKKIYTPEEFRQRRAQILQWFQPTIGNFSRNLQEGEPILEELAKREQPNMQKIISTIIFVHFTAASSGGEISGYIDYEHSLRKASLRQPNAHKWYSIFSGRILLYPKPDDLSYRNTHKNLMLYNHSDNFSVLHSLKNGLSFRHRGDHKVVCVDVSHTSCGQNSRRTMLFSKKYGYVVLYDHIIRKKI